jgi:hypothetical protein
MVIETPDIDSFLKKVYDLVTKLTNDCYSDPYSLFDAIATSDVGFFQVGNDWMIKETHSMVTFVARVTIGEYFGEGVIVLCGATIASPVPDNFDFSALAMT